MTDPVETFEAHGFTVKIHFDPEPGNPRNADNLGTLGAWGPRPRGGFGDVRHHTPEDWLREVARDVTDVGWTMDADDFDDLDDGELVEIIASRAVILPVDLGPHGDGWIYVEHSRIAQEYGSDTPENRDLARRCLEHEIETFRRYLDGMVYGYVVEDDTGEQIASCWGYYDENDARVNARTDAQLERERRDAE